VVFELRVAPREPRLGPGKKCAVMGFAVLCFDDILMSLVNPITP